MEELLSLKWNNHRSTFLHILTILRDKQLYTDATLACDGRFYSVHRLVLSTCSDYFCAMFDKTTTCKNPIIVLKDIKCEDLEALLDYMYLGEVNVRQADLASLIKSAECLRVKGLAVPDDEPPKKSSKENSRRSERGQSPPSKRKRLEDQDGRESVRPSGNRSKSPLSHSRLSPFTSQSASDDQDRLSPSQSTSERLGNATSNDAPKVKVEVIDDPSDEMGGSNSFNLQNDGFKEEADDTDPGGGGLPDDLPDFLQDSNSSYSQSYAGPSSFQPDLQSWQGDQVLSGNYSDLGFGPSQSQDGSQNTSGDKDFLQWGIGGIDPSLAKSKGGICDYCGKHFTDASNLRRHLMIHSGEKPYVCQLCDHSTNRKGNLVAHIAAVHKLKDGPTSPRFSTMFSENQLENLNP